MITARMQLISNIIKSAKENKINDFSFSAILRYVRVEEPKNVEKFIKSFKLAFDLGCSEELEDFEYLALMQACKEINLDLKKILE